MKIVTVNKENYRKYRYLDDYRKDALKALTDEELKAQLYHLKDIYRGVKGAMKQLQKIAERSVKAEMMNRKIK